MSYIKHISKKGKEERDSNTMGFISWKSVSYLSENYEHIFFFHAFLHFPNFLQ